MVLNPEEYNKIREQAVVESEAKAAKELKDSGEKITNRNSSHFEKVIDTEKELNAFFETAYKGIEAQLKITKDPQLKEKLTELKKIYDTKEEFNEWNDERTADEYWNALISVLEKDERANLKHGPEMMKNLGLPKDVKFVNYESKEGKQTYYLKRNGLHYYVSFEKDGNIELKLHGIHRSLDYYKSDSRGAPRESHNRRKISQHVSLMELRDGSAFDLHWQAIDVYNLSSILQNLTESLGKLPKLSTNQKLNAFIQRKNEMESLKDEMYALKRKQNRHLTPEQSEKYYQKVAALFKERLEEYYKMNPEKKETRVIGGILYDIVYENPRLAEIVIEVANTPDKMKIWDFGYSRGRYLHGTFKAHKEELNKKIVNSHSAPKDKTEKLPEDHKKYLGKIIVLGIFKDKPPESFLKYYKNLREDILYNYTDFLTSKEPRKIFTKTPKLLVEFTKACGGMTDSQFAEYSKLWLSYNDQGAAKLKKYEKILKTYKTEKDVHLVGTFLEATTKPGKIKKLITRVNKLVESQKIKQWELGKILEKKAYKSDEVLTWCEKLDKDYLDSHIKWMIDKLSLLNIKDKHIETLNSLTPLQRKVFDYLKRETVSCFIFEIKEFEKLLEAASTIKTEDQLQYVFDESYKAPSTIGRIRGIKIRKNPSQKQVIELSKKAEKYPKLWEAITKLENTEKTQKLSKEAYTLINFLIDKSVPQEKLTKLVKELSNIEYRNQVFAITSLFTPGNLEELVTEVAACKSKYSDLYFEGDFEILHIDFIQFKPNIKEISPFLDKLIAIKKNKKGLQQFRLIPTMEEKAHNLKELHKLIDYTESPAAIAAFKPFYESKKYPNIADLAFTINLYFYLAISIDDLKDPQKIVPGLQSFLEKADKEKYDSKTDPNYEKAKSLLDKKKILNEENNSFTHIAFILNVLQNSSQDFTKEKLQSWARKNLTSPKEKLRNKAAKLLIGTGTYTNKLKLEEISKIAQNAVDNKISKFTISDDITANQLNLIKEKGVNVPLSVYFSMLINMEQQNKQKDQPLFEKLVNKYKEIENQPVYHNQLLIIAHDKNDTTHSYIHTQDSFNPSAHETMAKAGGAKVLTLRHASDDESVESMLSRLELTKGNLDIVIGGHGGKNIISFGTEEFDMDALFERLAKRLQQQQSGKAWKTQILFSSCLSSYNIELLKGKWTADPRTKHHSIKMLSSSSEEKGSAKMADDSWFLKSKEIESSGRVLTWGELYRDIESRNFVMDIYGKGNSNMTLYENGEEYF